MPLFRLRCAGCASPSEVLCPTCRAQLEPPPTTSVRALGRLPALFAYSGTGAKVIGALKFGDTRRLVTRLADDLAELAHRAGAADAGCVSWVPTSAARRRQRGFDQSELLARAVARRLDVGCQPLLRRMPGPAQTGRDRHARAHNVAFSRRAWPRAAESGIVLIDDVSTTGATLRAAVAAMGPEQTSHCQFLVVARTP